MIIHRRRWDSRRGERRVWVGTHGWVWPARTPRRRSSCGQTAPRPWRPSSPGRVASSCGGGECRVRRENTLSVLRERLTFIFLGTALYDCQCMAYSLTRNYYTFLARPYPHTIRTKRGSSSDGRASALHAEGTGIDALLLQFIFYFLFLTGSRRDIGSTGRLHKTTVYDPTVRAAVHVSRFFGVPRAACFCPRHIYFTARPIKFRFRHRSAENPQR